MTGSYDPNAKSVLGMAIDFTRTSRQEEMLSGRHNRFNYGTEYLVVGILLCSYAYCLTKPMNISSETYENHLCLVCSMAEWR